MDEEWRKRKEVLRREYDEQAYHRIKLRENEKKEKERKNKKNEKKKAHQARKMEIFLTCMTLEENNKLKKLEKMMQEEGLQLKKWIAPGIYEWG